MQNHRNLKIALFCGGSGTRMWPMSRRALPKQFQPLINNLSTFEIMVNLLKQEFPFRDIFPITTRDCVGWIVKLAPQIPLENIVIEPQMRDTGAAVGLAAAVLDKKFDNPNVLAIWCDHVVRNGPEFIKAILLANQTVAETGKFVEIGVRPTFASTALGYLQVGKMLKKVNGIAVFEFVAQIEKFFPKGFVPLSKIQKAWGGDQQESVLEREYEKIPKTSIDFAVNSHLTGQDQVVVSADLGWRDVGTWNELKDEMASHPQDNILQGEVIDLDLKDCLVYSNKNQKVIAAIGLEGLIIVDTEDALLVCSKGRTHDVKKIIEKLKDAEKEEYL